MYEGGQQYRAAVTYRGGALEDYEAACPYGQPSSMQTVAVIADLAGSLKDYLAATYADLGCPA